MIFVNILFNIYGGDISSLMRGELEQDFSWYILSVLFTCVAKYIFLSELSLWYGLQY